MDNGHHENSHFVSKNKYKIFVTNDEPNLGAKTKIPSQFGNSELSETCSVAFKFDWLLYMP